MCCTASEGLLLLDLYPVFSSITSNSTFLLNPTLHTPKSSPEVWAQTTLWYLSVLPCHVPSLAAAAFSVPAPTELPGASRSFLHPFCSPWCCSLASQSGDCPLQQPETFPFITKEPLPQTLQVGRGWRDWQCRASFSFTVSTSVARRPDRQGGSLTATAQLWAGWSGLNCLFWIGSFCIGKHQIWIHLISLRHLILYQIC